MLPILLQRHPQACSARFCEKQADQTDPSAQELPLKLKRLVYRQLRQASVSPAVPRAQSCPGEASARRENFLEGLGLHELPGTDHKLLRRSSRATPESMAALSGLRSAPRADANPEQAAAECPAAVEVCLLLSLPSLPVNCRLQ